MIGRGTWTAAAALLALMPATLHGRAEVIGGTDAPAGAWPSLAALVTAGQTPSAGQFCGGTLIDPEWVLTAGHCVTEANGTVTPAAAFDVALGVTSLPTTVTPSPGTWQRIDVQSITRHPSYDNATLENDVALVRLATAATLTANPPVGISHLIAPTDRDLWEAGDPAEIAGWGNTVDADDGGPVFVNPLQQAAVPIGSDAFCGGPTSYGQFGLFTSTVMICAGPQGGGVAACNGDSGGPLTVIGRTGERVVVGATSFVISLGCDTPNFPPVYARLDAFRSFVYSPLGVTAPPAAPGGVSATPGTGSALVEWTPPAATGGRPIAGYRVATFANGVPAGTRDVAPGASTTVPGLSCGTQYRFTVTAATPAGLSPASAQTAPIEVSTGAPQNTAAPTISGDVGVGRTLNGADGQWTNCPGPLTRQWMTETAPGSGQFAAVPGATQTTYAIQPADAGRRILLRVESTNAGGPTAVTSAATAAVPLVPQNLSAPSISGVARSGRALNAAAGTWNVSGAVALQWRRETAPGSGASEAIPGATGTTYVPGATDAGRRLTVTATVTNPSGSTIAESAPVTVLPALTLRSLRAPALLRGPATTRIALRLGTEARSRLTIRVLDHRGRLVRAVAARSRIGGRAPASVAGSLVGRLGTGGVHGAIAVVRTNPAGVLRTVRILVTARAGDGTTARTVIRTRIRL